MVLARCGCTVRPIGRRSTTWSSSRVTPERARALLRGGADVRAGAPSPLERARTVGGEASALVLRAARWSEGSHELFPSAARAQAVAVLRLGYLLASARYATEATSLTDAWRYIVLPRAMAWEPRRE